MAKILLADDDKKLCDMIFDWLKKEGHIVDVALDGQEASDLLHAGSYDLLILDIAMPAISGIELCKQFRQAKGSAPVLILTGKTGIQDKVGGLDAGADDYLTKPFDVLELSARLRALLRRPVAIQDEVLRLRGLELDLHARRLTKDGKPLELFPREMALLEFFMKHPNQVFSLEALQERVWPSDSETSPESLRVNIARIRAKIETEGQNPILKTVHRQGYMFDSNC